MPFLASYSGQATFTGETTVSFDGTGIATQLGLGDNHADVTITGPDSSCPGGLANTHIETLTATNGDSLTITAHNVASPTDVMQFRGSGHWIVTAGTGRFDVRSPSTEAQDAPTVTASSLISKPSVGSSGSIDRLTISSNGSTTKARDSNPRPSPWQGDAFRPWRPLSPVEQAPLRPLVRPLGRAPPLRRTWFNASNNAQLCETSRTRDASADAETEPITTPGVAAVARPELVRAFSASIRE